MFAAKISIEISRREELISYISFLISLVKYIFSANCTIKTKYSDKFAHEYFSKAVPKIRKRKILSIFQNSLKTFLMTNINNYIYSWIALSVLYPNIK